MAKFHIFVAAALILCAAIGIIGFEMKQPAFIALFSVAGWLVSGVAVIVAAFLVVLLVIRSFTGTAGALLRRSWLGLVSGAAAIGFWVIFGL
jgi:hypothetical protein